MREEWTEFIQLSLLFGLLFYMHASIISYAGNQSDTVEAKTINSQYLNGNILIDGTLNEWNAPELKSVTDVFRLKSHNKMALQSMWNEEYLFLAFTVTDRDLKAVQTSQDHPNLYLDDMVEFLIDTNNDKNPCWGIDDIVYHINLLGQKKDDRGSSDCKTNADWNGKAQYAIVMDGTLNNSTDDDKGYKIEVAVSWKEMGINPSAGMRLGFNFANGDNGNLFDWVGATPFRSPHVFGNLLLGKQ